MCYRIYLVTLIALLVIKSSVLAQTDSTGTSEETSINTNPSSSMATTGTSYSGPTVTTGGTGTHTNQITTTTTTSNHSVQKYPIIGILAFITIIRMII
jgi:fibronectin type 3 domain-containing protein